MPTLAQARNHYRRQRIITGLALRAIRTAFRASPRAESLAAVVATYQLTSATVAGRSIAAMDGTPPLSRPAAFVGHTAAGFPLTDPLASILASLNAEVEADAARMLATLERFVASEVQDAARAASQVEIVARPEWTNYVRMLNLPSCGRCVVLAGRIYRDLDSFLRHPLCDCVMVPVSGWEEAHDQGLITSPREAFDRGQIRGLSQADAQAITDGADISQVVNAAQNMTTADLFGRTTKATTAGTTKRAAWRKANPGRPIRLRPEAIYANAKDRDDAIRLLRLYGYLTS